MFSQTGDTSSIWDIIKSVVGVRQEDFFAKYGDQDVAIIEVSKVYKFSADNRLALNRFLPLPEVLYLSLAS